MGFLSHVFGKNNSEIGKRVGLSALGTGPDFGPKIDIEKIPVSSVCRLTAHSENISIDLTSVSISELQSINQFATLQ